jgi:flavin-dependent dehydrogenase
MDEVAIAGAGPAGALAAILLAKAGLRVRLFDRARFPRPKLCGDTLNPGALAVLQRHIDVSSLIEQSDAVDGMLLTGPGGVRVRANYGRGLAGRAITREVLDQWLVSCAIEAGASFEEGALVKDAAMADGRVAGLRLGKSEAAVTHPARMVIAADGRRSTLAIGRGLARQPPRPRRWAVGSYFTGVDGLTTVGEMHVRRGHYLGIAPVPGGLANACLVVPHATGESPLTAPADLLTRYLRDDPELSARFARARAVTSPLVLGPMAVDARAAGEPGLLLAGDAAGFIDPMTGDGLHFALAGAELAAAVALDVLAGRTPIDRAHLDLAAKRHAAFSAKWRFNRALRWLVASPRGVSGAAAAAKVAPAIFEGIIRYAGDCSRLPAPGSRLSASAAERPLRRDRAEARSSSEGGPRWP